MPNNPSPAVQNPIVEAAPVVFALDLSMKNTGWAVNDLDGTRHGAQSFLVTKKQNAALRFFTFQGWFACMLDQHAPDVVLYEESDPRHMKSGQGVNCAVGLRTLVEMECARRDIPTKQIMPNSLKKAFTGSGNADKEAMKEAAAKRFGNYDAAADKGGDVADCLGIVAVWMDTPDVFEPKGKEKKTL
ncbi:MAG: crossover junction endodeoxyribonuclease RuvC [Armatimonadetes bacterium]|nr:crossover junction endodeoxyribonuclease RuvC [Armatimonadota bacterium]